MNYTEAIDWLENIPISFDSNYSCYEFKLKNIAEFLNFLGNPENDLTFIHVGGTNGKGSTCHIISSILQEHGYKVALFSSPHLYDFRERIKVNADFIDKKFVLKFIRDNIDYIKENKLSFFETTFALSLCYFRLIKPEYTIVEVGLGGRLDATNLINPIISIITNIGYDHKKFLGNNLIEIAKEKAGIIKSGVDILIGESSIELNQVFETKAKELNSNIYYADQKIDNYKTDLNGYYQHRNINTAISALKKIKSIKLNKKNILNGIENVIKNTNLIGRWQIVKTQPKVVYDVAHNIDSLELVFNQIKNTKGKIRIVFGTLDKTDQLDCLKIFPKKYEYYFCAPKTKRAMSLNKLCKKAKELKINFSPHSSVKNAYHTAYMNSKNDDTVLVTGSTYLFSEINN